MPPLFDHLDSIQDFVSLSPLGLITDIDGTISRTASTPAEAQVSPICLRHLSLLSNRLKLVAVVSGRPVTQMRAMLGLENIVYIGNHGFERLVGEKVNMDNEVEQYSALISAVLQDLKPLFDIEGIILENKGATASIHYRLCQDPESVARQILTAITSSPMAKGLQIRQGRRVVELFPQVEVNKGSAVRDLVREYQLRAVIYLGDDLTDLDAFRVIHEVKAPDFDGICIGIIDEETAPEVGEEANFTLNGVSEVERFFEWLSKVI
ncbi:trehalose-phosphatase [Chloroflexota bacterium]